jgi:signal recognition particle subunit SEC65
LFLPQSDKSREREGRALSLDLNAAKPQLEPIADAETSAPLGMHEGQVVRFGKGQFWVQK